MVVFEGPGRSLWVVLDVAATVLVMVEGEGREDVAEWIEAEDLPTLGELMSFNLSGR